MARVIGIARNRPWAVLFTLVFMVVGVLVVMKTVLAVHQTGAFELDGDATSAQNSLPPDDWDRVCYDEAIKEGDTPAEATAKCGTAFGTSGNNGSPAVAVSWTSETARAATAFTGGGSKDPQDISDWAWDSDGGLPDKDNLLHAYAVRYSLDPTVASGNCPNGTPNATIKTFQSTIKCDVLFFGLDRLDNSGDAQTGFWFLQNQVSLNPTVKSGGGFEFSGVHAQGDLLVISDFSNGGTTSSISVYKWESGCTGTDKPKKGVGGFPCAAANLAQLASNTASNCGIVSGGNDPFCGLVNANTIEMPWFFQDKSSTPNNGALNGEFYEAGINLSQLGLGGECFSTVVSETRASTSPTATLKDFIIGQFANCVPGLTTEASETIGNPVLPKVEVHDTATIKVTGGANPPDPTGSVTFFICGPLATDDTNGCTGNTTTQVGQPVPLVGGANTTDGLATANSADVNTDANPLGSGRYCFLATWPGDTTYPGALSHTDGSLECFDVLETSVTTTAQKWLPQDTATVTLGSGGAGSGSVTFNLYESADCSGAAVQTFADVPLVNGSATTNNSTYYTANTTISWRVTFTSSNLGVNGSTSHCERSTVTINNDTGS